MISELVASPAGSTAHRPRRSADETRKHVLNVAYELFYWEGIHATGIDRVAASADVATTTLYRLFGSKDELVRSYVDSCATGYREVLAEAADPSVGSARERILSVFGAIQEMVGPEVCRGCPFLMALAEFPDPDSPIHITAVEVKSWVRQLLGELAVALDDELGVRDPAALADQLALLLEGIYGSVQALSADGPAREARSAAAALLDAAVLPSKT